MYDLIPLFYVGYIGNLEVTLVNINIILFRFYQSYVNNYSVVSYFFFFLKYLVKGHQIPLNL